jgi:hypothetical protein
MENNQNLDKPFWSITQAEFYALQNKGIQETLKELLPEIINTIKNEATPKSDTIGPEEAMEITGYLRQTLNSKVHRREMPRLSSGRPLIFSRKELLLWIKLGKPKVAEMALMRRNGEI